MARLGVARKLINPFGTVLLQAVVGAGLESPAFALSTCPLLRGCAMDAKHSWMLMSSQYSWKSLLLNWVPLSAMMRFGMRILHTMDLRNATADFLVIFTTGVTSGHYVNLSMAT